MLSLKCLLDALNDRGISAVSKNLNLDSDKDVINGIVIKTNDITKEHVFNIDALLESADSIKNAADLIQGVLKKSELPAGIDYSKYLTKEYIKEHVRFAFKNRFWAPYIVRDSVFPGIQEYCYITGIQKKSKIQWMLELREDHLVDVSKEDLWLYAYNNTLTNKSFVSYSIYSLAGKQLSSLVKNSPLKDIYSITSPEGIRGGVQVLNPKLEYLFKKYSVDRLILYPQSANNFIAGPDIDAVKDTILRLANNDSNYAYLGENVFIVTYSDSLVVQSLIPFNKKIY